MNETTITQYMPQISAASTFHTIATITWILLPIIFAALIILLIIRRLRYNIDVRIKKLRGGVGGTSILVIKDSGRIVTKDDTQEIHFQKTKKTLTLKDTSNIFIQKGWFKKQSLDLYEDKDGNLHPLIMQIQEHPFLSADP